MNRRWLAIVLLIAVSGSAAPCERLRADTAPQLSLARGEDGKVTLAFAPLAGVDAYAVRLSDDKGNEEILENVIVAHKLRDEDCEGRLRPFPPKAVLGPALTPGR